jgi:hypothetical protein
MAHEASEDSLSAKTRLLEMMRPFLIMPVKCDMATFDARNTTTA